MTGHTITGRQTHGLIQQIGHYGLRHAYARLRAVAEVAFTEAD